METQKVILPFFYALFHAGFSSEENSSPILCKYSVNYRY